MKSLDQLCELAMAVGRVEGQEMYFKREHDEAKGKTDEALSEIRKKIQDCLCSMNETEIKILLHGLLGLGNQDNGKE